MFGIVASMRQHRYARSLVREMTLGTVLDFGSEKTLIEYV